VVSGRADVGVASTSDTLERAKTIGFSIPYFAFEMVVLTKEGTGIESYESLKGHKMGSVSGTLAAIRLEGDVDAWADANGSFTPYQTQADVFLALSQGQIDATVVTSTVANAAANSGDFEGFVVGGKAPYDIDYTAAKFEDGKKVKDAQMTVRHNGVEIHKDVQLTHATTASPLKEGPEPGPVYLQDHGNPVRYRNIWVVAK